MDEKQTLISLLLLLVSVVAVVSFRFFFFFFVIRRCCWMLSGSRFCRASRFVLRRYYNSCPMHRVNGMYSIYIYIYGRVKMKFVWNAPHWARRVCSTIFAFLFLFSRSSSHSQIVDASNRLNEFLYYFLAKLRNSTPFNILICSLLSAGRKKNLTYYLVSGGCCRWRSHTQLYQHLHTEYTHRIYYVRILSNTSPNMFAKYYFDCVAGYFPLQPNLNTSNMSNMSKWKKKNVQRRK